MLESFVKCIFSFFHVLPRRENSGQKIVGLVRLVKLVRIIRIVKIVRIVGIVRIFRIVTRVGISQDRPNTRAARIVKTMSNSQLLHLQLILLNQNS